LSRKNIFGNLLWPETPPSSRIPAPQGRVGLPAPGKAPDFPLSEIAAALEESSDFFLTDTWLGREPVEGHLGITGQSLDLNSVRPAGADSCTLTNALDPAGKPIRFRKDFDKVAAFVAEVRRAEKDFGESLVSKS